MGSMDRHYRIGDFPSLFALRLNSDDLFFLSRQGFVSQESRRNRTFFFKLRFRRNGRQVTRYIGNSEVAADVRRELDRLQFEARMCRRLIAYGKEARRTLRNSKRELEPLLKAHGLKFHGRAIRKSRRTEVNNIEN
jgi:hypothetical protein